MVTKTSHLPIRYFLALLWAHPILHISTIRVNAGAAGGDRCIQRNKAGGERTTLHCRAVAQPLLPCKRNNVLPSHGWRTHVAINNVINFEALPWKNSSAFSVLLQYTFRCKRRGTHSCLHAKCPTVLQDVNHIWSCSIDLRKAPVQNITKTCPVVAALIHADKLSVRHDTANSRFSICILTHLTNGLGTVEQGGT